MRSGGPQRGYDAARWWQAVPARPRATSASPSWGRRPWPSCRSWSPWPRRHHRHHRPHPLLHLPPSCRPLHRDAQRRMQASGALRRQLLRRTPRRPPRRLGEARSWARSTERQRSMQSQGRRDHGRDRLSANAACIAAAGGIIPLVALVTTRAPLSKERAASALWHSSRRLPQGCSGQCAWSSAEHWSSAGHNTSHRLRFDRFVHDCSCTLCQPFVSESMQYRRRDGGSHSTSHVTSAYFCQIRGIQFPNRCRGGAL